MAKSNPLISVVVPVYGCAASLVELCDRLQTTLQSITPDYDIILVNDASPDLAWEMIVELSEANATIKGLNLSRNFGQHYAITAGLDFAFGDYVIVMDCDLQDRPEEIPRLYAKALDGYEVVFGSRVVRQDNWFKRKASQFFYKIFDYLTERTSDYTVANFSISSQKVIRSFRRMREQNRVFPLFIQWMGYTTTSIPIQHNERQQGKSSYSLKKLISLGTDVLISQSNKPLRFSIQFGFLVSLLSLIYGVYLFIRYFFLAEPVQGWTSVMVSIWFFAGLMFFNFGIIGLYIGKIFNETKGRPLYLIQDKTDNIDH